MLFYSVQVSEWRNDNWLLGMRTNLTVFKITDQLETKLTVPKITKNFVNVFLNHADFRYIFKSQVGVAK